MTRPPDPTRRGFPVWLLPVALFVLVAWPLILGGFVRGRGAFDQLNYHEQAIRRFAEQLPTPDYSNYLSATTPGYHTVLAIVARVVSDQRWLLQLTGSCFTLVLIGLLGWAVLRGPGSKGNTQTPRPASLLLLVLPLMFSMAVFHAGVWMLPDNAGWLGVLGVWVLALRARFDWLSLIGGSIVLAALVSVRQIHLWPWALLITAAWLGSSTRPDDGFDLVQDLRDMAEGLGARLGRVVLTVLAGLPAVAILVWFWSLWGHSLTPPVFIERHVGANATAPAFVLAVFGSLGVFFLPFMADGLRKLWVRHTWLLVVAFVLAVGLGLAGPTKWSIYEGRNSGLWELVKHFPAPGKRSVLLVPLAGLGGVLLAGWFVELGRRDRWVMLAALVSFMAAQSASFQLWQRYTEPLVLLWLALAASRVPLARSGAGEGWRALGPMVLTGFMVLLTGASLVFGRPVSARALLFPGETEAPVLPGMVRSEREEELRNDGAGESDRSGDWRPGGRSSPVH